MKKNLLLSVLMLFSVSLGAFAQQDTTGVKSYIDANFPDNNSNFITPERLRNVSYEITRSSANLKERALFFETVESLDSIKSDKGFFEWNGTGWDKIEATGSTANLDTIISTVAQYSVANDSVKLFIGNGEVDHWTGDEFDLTKSGFFQLSEDETYERNGTWYIADEGQRKTGFEVFTDQGEMYGVRLINKTDLDIQANNLNSYYESSANIQTGGTMQLNASDFDVYGDFVTNGTLMADGGFESNDEATFNGYVEFADDVSFPTDITLTNAGYQELAGEYILVDSLIVRQNPAFSGHSYFKIDTDSENYFEYSNYYDGTPQLKLNIHDVSDDQFGYLNVYVNPEEGFNINAEDEAQTQGSNLTFNNYGLGITAGNNSLNVDQSKTQIDGDFRFTNGNQAAGKVLVSDANGDADWEDVVSGDLQAVFDADGAYVYAESPSAEWEDDGGALTITARTNKEVAMRTPQARLSFTEGSSGDVEFSDSRTNTVGIEYAADYSADFTSRSLVDKGYVDGITGWSLTGNASIPSTSFIGTTNGSDPLVFKRGGNQTGYLGTLNTFIGENAGSATPAAFLYSTAIGVSALNSSSTGQNNVAVGQSSLLNNTSGAQGVAIGNSSLSQNTTGNSNTAIGQNALGVNSTGSFNTAIGRISGFTGSTTGSKNTTIGYDAYVSTGGVSNSTAIGHNARVAVDHGFVLGGTGVDYVNVGIGTPSPDTTLHLIGQFKYEDGNEIAGASLVSDANGNATWTDPNASAARQSTARNDTATTGSSAQIPNVSNYIVDTDGALTSYSLVFPPNPLDGQVLFIIASSGTNITSLTLSSVSESIDALTTALNAATASYIYEADDTKWYKRN